VTVAIPTRNRADLALQAVASALGQTYPNVEVVVSDDASTDDTAERVRALEDPRVMLLRQWPRLGMTGNWQACLKAAGGDLFLLLGDDDLLEPEAIERLSAPFRAGVDRIEAERIGFSYSRVRLIDGSSETLWFTSGGPAVEAAIDMVGAFWSGRRGIYFSAVLARTADVRLFGYDDERFSYFNDVASWQRIALRRGFVARIDEPLVRYRLHGTNHSADATMEEWMGAAKRAVEATVQSAADQGDPAKVSALKRHARDYMTNAAAVKILFGLRSGRSLRSTMRDAYDARRHLLRPYAIKRLFREWNKAGLWSSGPSSALPTGCGKGA